MSLRLCIADLVDDIIGADASSEDENDGGTEDLNGESVDSDDDDSDDEDEDDDEDDDDPAKLKSNLEAVTAERDKYFRRMRRADRAKSKAENELKILQEGGSKELADARAENEKLKAQIASMEGTDHTAIIREEFRDYQDVKWHNPRLAFELLDLNEVDVDDNGKVDAASLKDAVAQLTKEHPYLVKNESSKTGEGNDENDEDQDKERQTPSGTRSSGSRKSRSNVRRKQIADKYGIRGRI